MDVSNPLRIYRANRHFLSYTLSTAAIMPLKIMGNKSQPGGNEGWKVHAVCTWEDLPCSSKCFDLRGIVHNFKQIHWNGRRNKVTFAPGIKIGEYGNRNLSYCRNAAITKAGTGP
jgi:hypothetical protein